MRFDLDFQVVANGQDKGSWQNGLLAGPWEPAFVHQEMIFVHHLDAAQIVNPAWPRGGIGIVKEAAVERIVKEHDGGALRPDAGEDEKGFLTIGANWQNPGDALGEGGGHKLAAVLEINGVGLAAIAGAGVAGVHQKQIRDKRLEFQPEFEVGTDLIQGVEEGLATVRNPLGRILILDSGGHRIGLERIKQLVDLAGQRLVSLVCLVCGAGLA